MKKVVYIQQYIKNSAYHPPKDLYPEFFTYGFAGRLGRIFNKYNKDYDVEVWRLDSSVTEYMEALIDGIPFRIFPAKGNKVIGIYSYKFLRQLHSLPEFTIVNVQNFHSLLTYHILLFAPRKIIVTAQHHGEWSPYFRITWIKGFRKLYSYLLLLIEKFLVHKIGHIFVIDKRAISYLKYKKYLENRVSFSSSGVDFSSWNRIDKKQARLSLSLDPDKKYLFYLGKYYEYKAVDRLCEIYKKIKRSFPEIQLFVAGGSKSDIYFENIGECGAIDFKFVPNNELPKYFSAADVYVCVSHLPDWFGGIGVAMLESLACSTPVVSNSLNQIADVSLINQIGRSPNSDDEMLNDILYVLNNTHEYQNCREIVKKFYDYEQIQKRTRAVYEQLLDKFENRN